MADPGTEAKNESTSNTAPAGGGSGVSIVLLIVPLLNTIAILGTFGFLYYTKVIYKRPAITEETERARLEKKHSAKAINGEPGLVNFEPITVNIASNPEHPRSADGTPHQIQGKLHYATLSFSIEIRDKNQSDIIEGLKTAIIDKIIHLVGKKQFHELTTVQGRYNLRAHLMEYSNKLIESSNPENPIDNLVTNVFFTSFIVQ